MKKITVLLFAGLKDSARTGRLLVEMPDGSSVADLKKALAEKMPALLPALNYALVSLNQEYTRDDAVLPDGAEVAIFPPVSGGSTGGMCALVEEKLDLNAILAQVSSGTSGAVCFFVGTVRSRTAAKDTIDRIIETDYLEYEGYKPMAETKLEQIIEEMHRRWPDVEQIAIYQRLGHLDPGDVAVVIACTGAHRHSGVFEAAAYAIERLKQIVPVWKKEVGTDGISWVEGGYTPDLTSD